MKPEAQKILGMIEVARPDDTAALDEIDARTDCLLKKWVFAKMSPYGYDPHSQVGYLDTIYGGHICPRFTRSIDAQEALRREGWKMDVYNDGTRGFRAVLCRPLKNGEGGEGVIGDLCMRDPYLSTEPLARLHAWVQVCGMEEKNV